MAHSEAPLSILACAELIRRGQLSPVEVVQAALADIERLNPRFNALLCTSRRALEDASRIQSRLQRRQPVGPLAGVPLSIKDLILTRDMPTTAGSLVFGAGIESSRDALLVKRLKRAGAVIIGKAHLHEFAYGVTNENAHFGPARNPHDSERVAGGSSGGSAVSVATGMCLGSVGTDTRGSIRIPSAFCGVVGLKPTRGRVPLDGILPLSWTLDHAGPIAGTVGDVSLLFEVLSRRRRRKAPPAGKAARLRIGICDYYWRDLDREVERPLKSALRRLESWGLEVHQLGIKNIDEALEASRVLAAADALAVHREYIRTKADCYDPVVLERMTQGQKISGVEVSEAFQLRRVLTGSFREAFRQVDVLFGATVPCLPPRVDAGRVTINGKPAPTVDSLVRLNSPQNLAGVPALVMPCGFSRGGLPTAMQFIAASGGEDLLFDLAQRFQPAPRGEEG